MFEKLEMIIFSDTNLHFQTDKKWERFNNYSNTVWANMQWNNLYY